MIVLNGDHRFDARVNVSIYLARTVWRHNKISRAYLFNRKRAQVRHENLRAFGEAGDIPALRFTISHAQMVRESQMGRLMHQHPDDLRECHVAEVVVGIEDQAFRIGAHHRDVLGSARQVAVRISLDQLHRHDHTGEERLPQQHVDHSLLRDHGSGFGSGTNELAGGESHVSCRPPGMR